MSPEKTEICSVLLFRYPLALPLVPPRAGSERMKKLRKEKATFITDVKPALQPLLMWPDSHSTISESPAPSIVPGWNRS